MRHVTAAALLAALAGAATAGNFDSGLAAKAGERFDGAVTVLAVDPVATAALRASDGGVIRSFPIGAGEFADLEITPISVLNDAAVVVNAGAGDHLGPAPSVALFGGQLAGRPGSRVFLSISSDWLYGTIVIDGRTTVISSGPVNAGLAPVVYRVDDLPPGLINLTSPPCGTDLIQSPIARQSLPGGGNGQRSGPCRKADIAIETDHEYLAMFGGNTTTATNYAITLLGAVSEIYKAEFNTSLTVSYLRLWETENDPWTSWDTVQTLFDFQDYWNANMTAIQRHAAHFLSPRQMSSAGGVAYFPALCYPEYDYGVSAYLDGYFPYPIQDHNSANWDLMVVAHEIGHNFGAPHTHDLVPPQDGCGLGDCSNAWSGTIMSYCHTCSGGMTNMSMVMGPRVINEGIFPYLDNDAPCNIICPVCKPDFDQSGFLDFDDFNKFVVAFEAGIDAADYDGSGFVDFDDFNKFVVDFELGC